MKRLISPILSSCCTIGLLASCAPIQAEQELQAEQVEQIYMSASRSVIYESLDHLKKDAFYIVVGTPQNQQEVDFHSRFTISTFAVAEVIPLAGLETSTEKIPSGSTIYIRQIGDTSMKGLPAPILEIGQNYLLFINPTELPGPEAEQFYVTGTQAGFYASEDGSAITEKTQFQKVGDDPDKLPRSLTLTDLR